MGDQLIESLRATADASGRAAASAGPQRYGERWTVTSMATLSDSTSESSLRVYKGSEAPFNIVATSYSGNQDTAGGSSLMLVNGDLLVAVWSNCSSGASCTLTIQGERSGRGV